MIIDLRIYTLKPNRMAEFVGLYKELGLEIQQKHLGKPVFWGTTIEGPLNQVVHIWSYENQADRETRRAAMAADPGWAAYLAAVAKADVLVHMENRMVRPADFSPLK